MVVQLYWLESQGTLRLINIINASAQNGGGMYISGENIDIYDSNIANSTSTYDGGAMYFNSNYHKVTNCTFEGCNATRYGGAVYIGNYITYTSIIQHSIILMHIMGELSIMQVV